jgi:hypothetical protein
LTPDKSGANPVGMILLVGAVIAAIIFGLWRFGQVPQPASHASEPTDRARPSAAAVPSSPSPGPVVATATAPPPPPPMPRATMPDYGRIIQQDKQQSETPFDPSEYQFTYDNTPEGRAALAAQTARKRIAASHDGKYDNVDASDLYGPPPARMPRAMIDRHVLIRNGANATLTGIYYRRPSSPTWGPDQLAGALAPGASRSLLFSDGGSQCWFDVRGHFNDGTEVTNRINACGSRNVTFTKPAVTPEQAAFPAAEAPPAPLPDSQDRHVKIVNGTNVALVTFYFSAKTSRTWGSNKLPGPLGPSVSIVLNISDGSAECLFDVRSHFSDGADKIEQINSCDIGSHTVTK